MNIPTIEEQTAETTDLKKYLLTSNQNEPKTEI